MLFSHEFINQLPRCPFQDYFWGFITLWGNELILILILLWFLYRGYQKIVVIAGSSFFLSIFFNALLKALFALPRPSIEKLSLEVQPLAIQFAEGTFGFPSGHAQIAAGFYLLLGILYPYRWKIFFFFLSITIPYSRIYLGVHFLGDILGGYLLGLLIAFFSYRYIEKLYTFLSKEPILIGSILTSLGILIGAIINYPYLWKTTGALVGFLFSISLIYQKEKNLREEPLPWSKSFLIYYAIGVLAVFLIKVLFSFLPAWAFLDMLEYASITFFAVYIYSYNFIEAYY